MNYSAFTAEDFASDNSFQNWVFKRNPQDATFWEAWVLKNPHKKEEVAEAMAILKSFRTGEPEIDLTRTDKSWEKLESIIELGETQNQKHRGLAIIHRRTKNWYKYAAVVAMLIVSLVVYRLLFLDQLIVYSTDFGETSSITLPDNSVVTLNSNSCLKYDRKWDEQANREVWLDGEAYFSVVKTGGNRKFYVKGSGGLLVEVLGTEFNVTSRRSRTRVVLNTGKIRLNINKPSLQEDVIMLPGELVEFKDTPASYVKKKVNPELYTSWKCKKLMFEDTKLEEVVLLLEEIYGLEVTVSEPGLLEKKVSGSAPSDNINLLINGLSESFGISIVRTNKHVKISKK